MKTPERNDLKLGTVIVLDSLSKVYWFWVQKVMVQEHVIISNFLHPLHICRTDAVTTNFVHKMHYGRAVFTCGSKIMPECAGCHKI